jgi:hypothetical protein
LVIDDDGGSGANTLLTVYKDGALRGSLETTYNLSQLVDNNNWIGRSQYGDNTANASYDEFRIYDEALKQNQIVHHNTLGPNNVGLLPAGFYPLADWRFNTDDDGNPVSDGQALPNGGGANTANLFDETRNFHPRHQGETRDTPHYRAYNPAELAGRVGVADGFALGTGGGGVGEGYVFFRDDTDLRTNNDFSVWGRVKRLSNIGGGADEFIFSQPNNWDFAVNSGGTLDVDIGGLYGDTGVPINVGQWYDLGLVLDENGATDTVKIFVDGALVSTFTGAVSFAGTDWFHIGAGPGGTRDFHALFDRVIFWDEAVSAWTMNQLTTPEPGSVVLLAGGLAALIRRRRRA